MSTVSLTCSPAEIGASDAGCWAPGRAQAACWPRGACGLSPPLSRPQIEEALVRRKKMELLQKYTSETLQAQSEEARRLLGY